MPRPGARNQRPDAADVLIVGAGPVGMVTALDLAQRGITTLLVERTGRGAERGVRCNHTSARTMEIFRRLGIAGEVRATGLPPDHPHDVVWRTAFVGTDIARIRIPGTTDRFLPGDYADSGWLTPEPPHRINQQFLEPLLLEEVIANRLIEVRFDETFVDLTQTNDAVRARVTADGGHGHEYEGAFLIGCDGSRSAVRRSVGLELQEATPPAGRQTVSTLIDAPQLDRLQPTHARDRAWCTEIVNNRQVGTVFAVDGHDQWLVHCHFPSTVDLAGVDYDAALRALLDVGDGFEYHVRHREVWSARSAVATAYQQGRVFLAGDAAHIWMPMGGYGMNAGIADGANLAWKLAVHLRGLAPRQLLDSYEPERRPVTVDVAKLVMGFGRSDARKLFTLPDGFDEDSERGRRLRLDLGPAFYARNVDQFCCEGLNFGYHYAGSPVICSTQTAPPSYTIGTYTPSSLPGCRAPHLWLSPGESLYDRLGTGFALIVDDEGPWNRGFEDAAAKLGLEFSVINIAGLDGRERYGPLPVLVRPDQHVAWQVGCEERSPVEALRHALGYRSGSLTGDVQEDERSVA